MELNKMAKLLIKNNKLAALALAAGLFLGITANFIPRKYVASGSLFIGRSVQPATEDFFGYEGYYAEQAGAAYTNTAAALAESLDVRKSTLEKLGVVVDDVTLFDYGRAVRVKKAGPHLVSVSTKSANPDEAAKIWQAVTDSIIEANKNVNVLVDPQMTITKITQEPVVSRSFYYLWQFPLAGVLLAFAFIVMYLSVTEPRKGSSK